MKNHEEFADIKVAALAGGVGGAKLADGLAQILRPDNLTIIVNTGDDFEHLGLTICPDLDTVCYTLAGIANPMTGWGRSGESWKALKALGELGGPTWFRLGDRDLGLNLERTRRLRAGQTLAQITHHFCLSLGVGPNILPMSDDPISTCVLTEDGSLPFQEYFVRRQCQPRVTGFWFEGVEQASPAPGVIEALLQADLVVLCPSNPWVSIDPILAVPGVLPAIQSKPVLAVSPIIAGRTVKGPATKMFAELGLQPSAQSVAEHYGKLLSGFVLDTIDTAQAEKIRARGIAVLTTDIFMENVSKRIALAKEVVRFGIPLLEEQPEQ
jgi:LPPG:FO 2-phospho-L-lactate transferase